MDKDHKQKKYIKGTVVSVAMDKSVVVTVSRVKTHPLYHKKYSVNKKYTVHDFDNKCQVGDIIEISSVRPISKTKKHIVVRKIS